jgi:hypothetical protein
VFTARDKLDLCVSFTLTLVFKEFNGPSQTAKTNIYCRYKSPAANLFMLRMSPYRREIFLALPSILVQNTSESYKTHKTRLTETITSALDNADDVETDLRVILFKRAQH